MRWQRILILGAAVAAMAATSIPAVAAPSPVLPITGSWWWRDHRRQGSPSDSCRADGPVAGTVVDTAVTAADGSFALLPDDDPAIEEYAVFVVADEEEVQAGTWVAEPVPACRRSQLRSSLTGDVRRRLGDRPDRGAQLVPARHSRRLGDQGAVAGVVVTARDEVDRTIAYGRDTTNARGVFVITA